MSLMVQSHQYRNFGTTAAFAPKKTHEERDVFFWSKGAETIQKKENEAMSEAGLLP